MASHEKVASGQAHALQGPEEAGIHRRHRSAALADHVVMVTIDEPEVGGPVNVDLLDEAGRAQTGQRPVHGHETEVGAGDLSALPDRLARCQVAARRERLHNGDALGRHAPFGPSEERNEAGAV